MKLLVVAGVGILAAAYYYATFVATEDTESRIYSYECVAGSLLSLTPSEDSTALAISFTNLTVAGEYEPPLTGTLERSEDPATQRTIFSNEEYLVRESEGMTTDVNGSMVPEVQFVTTEGLNSTCWPASEADTLPLAVWN